MFFRPRTITQAFASYQTAAVVFYLTLIPQLGSAPWVWISWFLFVAALATSAAFLWRNHPAAGRLFRWTQYAQIPQIAVGAWSWCLSSPGMITAGVNPADGSTSFVAQFGPTLALGKMPMDPQVIAVNVLPLVMWLAVFRTFPTMAVAHDSGVPAA